MVVRARNMTNGYLMANVLQFDIRHNRYLYSPKVNVMKALFNIVCLLLIAAVPTTHGQFLDEARDDASFIGSGFGQNDCYLIKIGDLTTEKTKVSVADVQTALSNEVTAHAEDGCVAVDKVTYTGLHIVYSDGSEIDYPAELMANLRSHAPSAERLLHNAVSVSVNELSVVDTDGNSHAVEAKWSLN